MRSLAGYLPAIACGAMMLLICVPMLLGRKHHHGADAGASREEVAELRDEIARLKSERSREETSEVVNG